MNFLAMTITNLGGKKCQPRYQISDLLISSTVCYPFSYGGSVTMLSREFPQFQGLSFEFHVFNGSLSVGVVKTCDH